MTIITINGLTDEQNETIRDIIENEYTANSRVREAMELIEEACLDDMVTFPQLHKLIREQIKKLGIEEK